MHVYNILTFADRQAFREWLGMNGAESYGIWLLFGKKGGLVTLSAGEALEEALCHGWIDGQIQSIDENTYKKYFARRRPGSKWSVKNKELAKTLIEKGLMTRQGLETIELARKNGLWDRAKLNFIDDEQIQMFKKLFSLTNLLIAICWPCRIRYSVHIPDFILMPNLTKPVKPGWKKLLTDLT